MFVVIRSSIACLLSFVENYGFSIAGLLPVEVNDSDISCVRFRLSMLGIPYSLSDIPCSLSFVSAWDINKRRRISCHLLLLVYLPISCHLLLLVYLPM